LAGTTIRRRSESRTPKARKQVVAEQLDGVISRVVGRAVGIWPMEQRMEPGFVHIVVSLASEPKWAYRDMAYRSAKGVRRRIALGDKSPEGEAL
jgi:hypothetical protein